MDPEPRIEFVDQAAPRGNVRLPLHLYRLETLADLAGQGNEFAIV